ncbi:MAG TPA: 23S rRNA (uracil(1939)-C(5))-methyltransferase RlmD [Patescibacteria group bacterium]|nr:23S rRNA (uracil(1939)-C(5))-methyltransferase RlmD [Patescibacteria group bacterium]
MKFGERLTGKIERFDQKGCGAFTFSMPNPQDGTREVVVPFTAPGDEIEATFVRREQKKWMAKLDRITTPSSLRVIPPCPFAGICGGCLWQHVKKEAQRESKSKMINEAFAEAGHNERIKNTLPCPDPFYYRNRMDYVWGWNGELGLKAYGAWNRYLDLTNCLLLDQETPAILALARTLSADLRLVPWDAKKQSGDLRYFVIRLGKNTSERMITLVVHDANRFSESMRQELVKRFAPHCTTLYLGENPSITDLSLSKNLFRLHGNEFLTEEVNGLRYLIHPNSFFQTNTKMAAQLQTTVLSFLGDLHQTRLLDLYCGLGFFGIAAAHEGATIFGYELDAEAISLAKKNAALNGVDRQTEFASGPAESLVWSEWNPDTVILDPPRAGLHPRVIKRLLEQKPRTMVYVSCNYHSFVKELALFKTAYQLEQMIALDLFPQTPHVELVSKLVLRA